MTSDQEAADLRIKLDAFAVVRPDLVHDTVNEPNQPLPLDRASWETGIAWLATARAEDAPIHTQTRILADAVGQAAAREFLAWETTLTPSFDVEAALASGTVAGPMLPPDCFMFAAALAAAVAADPTRDRVDTAVRLIGPAVGPNNRDIAITFLRRLTPLITQYRVPVPDEYRPGN